MEGEAGFEKMQKIKYKRITIRTKKGNYVDLVKDHQYAVSPLYVLFGDVDAIYDYTDGKPMTKALAGECIKAGLMHRKQE